MFCCWTLRWTNEIAASETLDQEMPIVAVGDKSYELSEVLASDRLDALFSDAWTGSRVWNASIFLSKQLLRLHDERQFITTALQSVCYLSYEERGDNAALADFHACSRDYLTHELVLQEGKIHLYRITQKDLREISSN
ncbi:hypothetical protein DYB30_010496 [Aphanomyces astaci]|uniref:Uncharacterized protein n=1 Tax=Aphanomyces astaci TaxID=112090 RepID=A0A397CJM0_APHAT|nr:hypothetical protein DYB30_010496 [Aphanomyces astaci]